MSYFGDGNLRIWIEGTQFKYEDVASEGSIPLTAFNTSPVIPPVINCSIVNATNSLRADAYIQTPQIKPVGTGDITIYTTNKIIASNATTQMEIFPNPPSPQTINCQTITAQNITATGSIGATNVATTTLTTGSINGSPYSPITGIGLHDTSLTLTTLNGPIGGQDITSAVKSVMANATNGNIINATTASIGNLQATNISGVGSINGMVYPPPGTSAAAWSSYPAVAPVDFANQTLSNVFSISSQPGYMLLDTPELAVILPGSQGAGGIFVYTQVENLVDFQLGGQGSYYSTSLNTIVDSNGYTFRADDYVAIPISCEVRVTYGPGTLNEVYTHKLAIQTANVGGQNVLQLYRSVDTFSQLLTIGGTATSIVLLIPLNYIGGTFTNNL